MVTKTSSITRGSSMMWPKCTVWDFCADKDLPETDLKNLDPIEIASFPESRITAMAPLPEGVAKATIVSLAIIRHHFATKIL